MKLGTLAYSKYSIKHAAAPWAAITSVTGFVSDVFKPEGNLAPYLLALSLFGTLVCLFLFRKKSKKEGLEAAFNSSLGGFLTFFFLSSFAWVFLTYLFLQTPPQGFVASQVPAIAELQANVFQANKTSEVVKEKSIGLEKKIEELEQNGTLIDDPHTAADFYQNAVFYKIRGNYTESVKAYEKFLLLEPNYFDVHYDYQNITQTFYGQQGAEKIKGFYQILNDRYPQNQVVQFAESNLLKTAEQRILAYQKLNQEDPSFPLAYMRLARELRLQATPLARKRALVAYQQFEKFDQEGKVVHYFLNKKELNAARSFIENWKESQKVFEGDKFNKPFNTDVRFLENSVYIEVTEVSDSIRRIFYSVDHPEPLLKMAFSSKADSLTGKHERFFFTTGHLPPGKHILYLKYLQKDGQESEVLSEEIEVPVLEADYSIARAGEVQTSEVPYRIHLTNFDNVNYDYYYRIGSESREYKVENFISKGSGQVEFEVKLPPGNHEFYYYGKSAQGQTAVYKMLVSP